MSVGTIPSGRPRTPIPSSGSDLPPDRDLLARFARGGDQQAFAALVRRHGPAVLGVCRRVLRDPHAAEDAFQVTFLILARKAGAIERPEALASWLYGVAVRVACKARAAGGRVPVGTVPEPPADAADPAAGLAGEELRLILDEELCRMPDRDRDLIVLVYLEGKTHDEAARAIGCPLGSVAWRLTRARDDLRRRLVRRGVTLSVGAVLLLASVGRAQAVSEGLVGRLTAAAARPGPAPALPATTRGRRVPIGCVLPLALLLTGTAVAVGGWGAADRDHTPPKAAAPAGPTGPHPPVLPVHEVGGAGAALGHDGARACGH